MCVSVLEAGCRAAPWVGTAGNRPWGCCRGGSFSSPFPSSLPPAGAGDTPLGFFQACSTCPGSSTGSHPPRPLRSSGDRRPALNANGVVGNGLNTHSYPPGSPSGASWNVSANTSKSRGQSPGPNHHPQLLSASAPRPSAIPPPSLHRQRPESLLTPTADMLMSPLKPTVMDF